MIEAHGLTKIFRDPFGGSTLAHRPERKSRDKLRVALRNSKGDRKRGEIRAVDNVSFRCQPSLCHSEPLPPKASPGRHSG